MHENSHAYCLRHPTFPQCLTRETLSMLQQTQFLLGEQYPWSNCQLCIDNTTKIKIEVMCASHFWYMYNWYALFWKLLGVILINVHSICYACAKKWLSSTECVVFFQKQLKIKIQVIHISGICIFDLQKTSILVLKTVGGVNRTIGVHYRHGVIFINYQISKSR